MSNDVVKTVVPDAKTVVPDTLVSKMSGTNHSEIELAWLGVGGTYEESKKTRAQFKAWKDDNTVQWLVGYSGVALQVTRHSDENVNDKIVKLCNTNNASKNNYTFNRVFTIARVKRRQTTTRLMTVGYNCKEEKFYLLGNGSMVAKLSTVGSNPSEEVRAESTIEHAIELALENKSMDNRNMSSWVDLPVIIDDAPARTFQASKPIASLI